MRAFGWNRPREEGMERTAAPHPQLGGGGGGGTGEGPVRSVVRGQGLDQSCVRSETLMETLEGALLGASGPLQVRRCGQDVCAGRAGALRPRPPTHGL